MEGKEVRFGIAGSALFAEVSTASSDGAVNSMHDSFLPLSGGILLGETEQNCHNGKQNPAFSFGSDHAAKAIG